MSWLCSNCSTSNEEKNTCCDVCGCDRPTEEYVPERVPEVVEGQVVFSDFAVIKESVKGFFVSAAKISRKVVEKIKSLSSKLPSRERREKKRAPRESRERIKPPKREKVFRRKKDLTKPWPEHSIRFDADTIRSKGFVRWERAEMKSVKGYTFYTEDGTSRFIMVDMLLVLGMANSV